MNSSSTTANQILLQLFRNHTEDELRVEYPALLILLADHFLGMEQAIPSFRELKELQIGLYLWPSTSLRRRHSIGEIITQTGIDSLVDWAYRDVDYLMKVDSIFVPVLPVGLAAQIARCDDQDPFVRCILAALLRGIPVKALSWGADLMHGEWKRQGFDHANASLHVECRKNLRIIANYGVNFLRPDDVRSAFAALSIQTRRVLVTEEVVRSTHRSGKKILTVHGQSIITPLARDVALELGMKIIARTGERS